MQFEEFDSAYLVHPCNKNLASGSDFVKVSVEIRIVKHIQTYRSLSITINIVGFNFRGFPGGTH